MLSHKWKKYIFVWLAQPVLYPAENWHELKFLTDSEKYYTNLGL